MLFNGPKETRGAQRCVHILDISEFLDIFVQVSLFEIHYSENCTLEYQQFRVQTWKIYFGVCDTSKCDIGGENIFCKSEDL